MRNIIYSILTFVRRYRTLLSEKGTREHNYTIQIFPC